MKILVAIAHYGSKNEKFVRQLIAEYRSMPHEVEIHLLCERPKGYGLEVIEQVGLPTQDPWSLPFGHKKLFVERCDEHELFIYTEDDVLLTADHVQAFMEASQALQGDLLPGFIRYEIRKDGTRNYPDIHGPFHWDTQTVRQEGDYIHAELTNEHAACFLLTQQQLKRAIASGGFDVPPHASRYDLLCTAATDPYTQCGFRKVICISDIRRFEIHHLPNVYAEKVGIGQAEYEAQVQLLKEIAAGQRSAAALFSTVKQAGTLDWDKWYDEPCHADLLESIPAGARRVLSVGSGLGALESALKHSGREVVAIPLDAVVGARLAAQQIPALPPDFEAAFQALKGQQFDAVLLCNVLQHLPDPAGLVARLTGLLAADGVVLGSVPNLGWWRQQAVKWLAPHKRWRQVARGFEHTRLMVTSQRITQAWLRRGGLRRIDMRYRKAAAPAAGLKRWLPGSIIASDVVFVARG